MIEITSTLDQIPDERHIFMKINYNDAAPADYEPPFFQSATPEQIVGHFQHKPFTMCDINTLEMNEIL